MLLIVTALAHLVPASVMACCNRPPNGQIILCTAFPLLHNNIVRPLKPELHLFALLQEDIATQSDMVGATEAPKAGLRAMFTSKAAAAAARTDVFVLGTRGAILQQLDQPALIPHVAEAEGKKYPYEVRAKTVGKGRTPCTTL